MLVGKLRVHLSNMQARKKALLPPPRPRTTGEKGMSVCHHWWHGPVENKSSSPCSWEKVRLKSLEIKVCILGCNGMCMCSNWGDAQILHLRFVVVHLCVYTWHCMFSNWVHVGSCKCSDTHFSNLKSLLIHPELISPQLLFMAKGHMHTLMFTLGLMIQIWPSIFS